MEFIVFEKDSLYINIYEQIIKKFMFDCRYDYDLNIYKNFNEEIKNKIRSSYNTKIYMISTDDYQGKTNDVIKFIRMSGDVINPIIVITNDDDVDTIFLKNTMILNIIKKNKRLIDELYMSLREAFNIINKYKCLTFSYYSEYFRIPYSDIYYIEKNFKDDSVTIVTTNKLYKYYISLKGIEEILKDDPRFIKTHRSCIINLFHVIYYDKTNSIIKFDNGKTTDLICFTKRKLFADMMNFSSSINIEIKS